MTDGRSLAFFLGGHDLELETIAALVRGEGLPVFDKNLTWADAFASAYCEPILAAMAGGRTPVLVELKGDLGLPENQVVVVDHHGVRAGADMPTSLHQVFTLLRLPAERWTRWLDLVAANDRGYIDEMMARGATADELAAIRAADRKAQGVSTDDDKAAAHAVAHAEVRLGGRLTIVRLAHDKTSAVTDCLHPALGGAGFKNLLVLSRSEVNYFGCAEWCHKLDERFPGGWIGGALPVRGFWGNRAAEPNEVLTWIADRIEAHL